MKEFFARLILNFIFILSIVIACVCGLSPLWGVTYQHAHYFEFCISSSSGLHWACVYVLTPSPGSCQPVRWASLKNQPFFCFSLFMFFWDLLPDVTLFSHICLVLFSWHLLSYGCGGGSVTKSYPTLVTPWTGALQVPLSMEFPRQEYWSGLPFPSPRDLPDPGFEPTLPTL